MTRGVLHAGSISVDRVADLVAQSPGITSNDVPGRLGLSADFTRKVVQTARAAGLIRAVRVEAHLFGWFPVGPLADAAEQKWKATAKARHAKRNREGQARFFKSRKVENIGPELPGRPIRRRVKADKPLPFKLNAPASVFHLGAML
mgnify:CR=1 FL=1|jgi:hypothetical protein